MRLSQSFALSGSVARDAGLYQALGYLLHTDDTYERLDRAQWFHLAGNEWFRRGRAQAIPLEYMGF